MIKEMLGNEEKVCVYLSSDEICKKFFDAAASESFRFGDLPRDKWQTGYVIAVHSDRNMGHVPLFLWVRSFDPEVKGSPIKIDYSKYAIGDKSFLCEQSNFMAEYQK